MLILIQAKEKMLLIVLKHIFFKLVINIVYGKTMESLRKRIYVRLFNNCLNVQKICKSKPSFASQNIFSKILLLFIRLYQF